MEKFDFKNLLKAPYVYYMAVGLGVAMVLPKLLKRKLF